VSGGVPVARKDVALDALGGDHAPGEIVAGAVQAAREFGASVILTGPEAEVRAELARHATAGLDITVEDAPEVVAMEEHATDALKKKRSSMAVAVQLVKEGRASAAVSAGNSGAMMAVSLFGLGRVRGIDRPALGIPFPTQGGKPCLLLDVGANADCRPQHLVQFALMGSVYAERAYGVTRPRVGLLSIGEEEGKGNQLIKETYPLLKEAAQVAGLNFVGNVEGKDLPAGGADVVVCDGYTGNVVLKLSEGLARMIREMIREAAYSSALSKVGGALLRPALERRFASLDWRETGGSLLMGLRGVSLVGHGRSDARAIRSAIRTARQIAASQPTEMIAEGMGKLGALAKVVEG
jgi:glycerol-3-phosphate acyltransferase PlsX